MAQASILAADRDIFLRHWQLEGHVKLDHQVRPLENVKTQDAIDSGWASAAGGSDTTKMLLYSH